MQKLSSRHNLMPARMFRTWSTTVRLDAVWQSIHSRADVEEGKGSNDGGVFTLSLFSSFGRLFPIAVSRLRYKGLKSPTFVLCSAFRIGSVPWIGGLVVSRPYIRTLPTIIASRPCCLSAKSLRASSGCVMPICIQRCGGTPIERGLCFDGVISCFPPSHNSRTW